jgi:hypothetical protein
MKNQNLSKSHMPSPPPSSLGVFDYFLSQLISMIIFLVILLSISNNTMPFCDVRLASQKGSNVGVHGDEMKRVTK